ncbi:acyltransferase, WS/DGAT/MGAT [Saccharomonospora azurea SZMC 14600]|nr:acyltransferase, WS/DGAT/MGAT [Saccharomonospora azurea SZMC 14600]
MWFSPGSPDGDTVPMMEVVRTVPHHLPTLATAQDHSPTPERGAMPADRLSALDTAFLCIDRPTAPMHMGAVGVFAPPAPTAAGTRPASPSCSRSEPGALPDCGSG